MFAELSCSCELTVNEALTWSVIDFNMEPVGLMAIFGSAFPNPDSTFAGGHFIATVTEPSEGTIASIATGTINQTTDGYTWQCVEFFADDVVGDTLISIPGMLVLEFKYLINISDKCMLMFDIQLSPPSLRI